MVASERSVSILIDNTSANMESVLLLLAGYLLGSVPTTQIAAQLLAGVDLRERSPTISGSGVYYLVAR